MSDHVVFLTATGQPMSVEVPSGNANVAWQIQNRSGVPIGRLPHHGRKRGPRHIELPAMPEGTRYQLVVVIPED